jgi:hypothetical protein
MTMTASPFSPNTMSKSTKMDKSSSLENAMPPTACGTYPSYQKHHYRPQQQTQPHPSLPTQPTEPSELSAQNKTLQFFPCLRFQPITFYLFASDPTRPLRLMAWTHNVPRHKSSAQITSYKQKPPTNATKKPTINQDPNRPPSRQVTRC